MNKGVSNRQYRVGELIRHALVEVFNSGRIFDTALADVSITVSEVRVSSDLRSATVLVVPFYAQIEPKEFLAALKRATPELRSMIGGKLYLKFTPELHFKLDQSFDQAATIDELLNNIPQFADEEDQSLAEVEA
jgi:ribosome-binding factor A